VNCKLAEQSFQRALQLAPRDGDTLHNYGWFLCQQRRYDDADVQFNAALAAPQYAEVPRTLMARGVCQARAGRWLEAERSLAARSSSTRPTRPPPSPMPRCCTAAASTSARASTCAASTPARSVERADLWLAARIERRLGNMPGRRGPGAAAARTLPRFAEARACCVGSSMTDLRPRGPTAAAPTRRGARSAGAMLKAAREREGLHVAVLAATIKVAPAKLEALEQDRYDELPNATFTRALAQSVCRSLKIDPRPVLALLPQVEVPPSKGRWAAEHAVPGPPVAHDGAGLAWASKPMFWAGGLLLLAAVVVGMVPPDLVQQWMSSPPPVALPASAPASAGAAVLARLRPRLPHRGGPGRGGPCIAAWSSVVAASAVVRRDARTDAGAVGSPVASRPPRPGCARGRG
jgi:transcriptional regulator with XRE-family HTH domain